MSPVVHYALVFEVTEHALFPGRPGGGNSAATLEYIPGSALRGALVQRFLRRGGKPEDISGLFERNLRFLDGRLRIDDQRSVPVPATARRCKNCGQRFKDLVGADRAKQRCDCGGDFKSFAGWRDPGTQSMERVQKTFIGRTEIEKGTAKKGSLRFASCLEAGCGQRFEARIVGERAAVDRLFEAVCLGKGEALRMGSASAISGRFEIVEAPTIVEHPNASELCEPVGGASGRQVAIDLLSRALLIDNFMRAVTIPEPPDGWHLAEINNQPWAYTATGEVHGWNAGQQLPKQTDVCVTAGSVIVIEPHHNSSSEVCADSLQNWVDLGIGLRRSEGFGEVSFRPVPADREEPA